MIQGPCLPHCYKVSSVILATVFVIAYLLGKNQIKKKVLA